MTRRISKVCSASVSREELTVRRPGQQRRQRGQLILSELLRVFVPGILVGLAEVARAPPHGGRHGDRVVGVLGQDGGQQVRHPTFDGVRVALHQGADAQDRGVSLA